MAFVYVLKSKKDNRFYIGSTTDLNRRLKQHQSGYVQSTKTRLPIELYAYQFCDTIKEAALLERKYKNSHGTLERALKKQQLKIK